MGQSVEWYHALETFHVPTELVVYPRQGHIFNDPKDARDYTLRTLEWFEKSFSSQ
jgi:dipeptidyl aminopeptidase/acylaminoacyl peptidase